jgi:hypothetical protein
MKILQLMKNCSPEIAAGCLLAALVLSACQASRTPAAGSRLQALGGTHWLSRDYLQRLDEAGTPAAVRNAACLELGFSATLDSMALLEGGRSPVIFSVSMASDSSFVARRKGERRRLFLEAGGKTLVCETEDGPVRFSPLDKKYVAAATAGWRSGTVLFLNERLWADHYLLLNPAGEPTMPVVFSSYGEVAGLADYTRYDVCYRPDCFPGGRFDAVALSDGRVTDSYIWAWHNDTLQLFSIVSGAGGARGESKGPEIFRFVKKR